MFAEELRDLKRCVTGPVAQKAVSACDVDLFIYYQFLSKTGVTQKAKPVQGASPQKLHTTYK